MPCATAPPPLQRCAANCPKGFPLQRSFNRCANRAGRTTSRVNAVRTTVQANKRSLAAVERPIEDASCPQGEPGRAGLGWQAGRGAAALLVAAASTQTDSWERALPALTMQLLIPPLLFPADPLTSCPSCRLHAP